LEMPGVDIAILMDETGSLDHVQEQFKPNVQALFQSMTAQMVGARAALLGFGTYNTGGHSEDAHVHTPLTDDLLLYQAAANELVASGMVEPSCEALITLLEATDGPLDIGFTEGNDFCVALITDEISNHGKHLCCHD